MRSTENEEWRPVPGYGGFYEVSSFGGVRSWKNGKYGRRDSPKTLKTYTAKDGYVHVSLCRDGRCTDFLVHVLVAECFLREVDDPATVVIDHKDDDRGNNTINNLQWLTPRENAAKSKAKYSDLPTGVSRQGSRFRARIFVDGDNVWLGAFGTAAEAEDAYGAALLRVNSGTFVCPKRRELPRGVTRRKNRYQARYRGRHLGLFLSAEAAAAAYLRARTDT